MGGSNENQNKLIRRWIPKGTPLEKYTQGDIDKIEKWINDYPRKLFKGKTSKYMLEQELLKTG